MFAALKGLFRLRQPKPQELLPSRGLPLTAKRKSDPAPGPAPAGVNSIAGFDDLKESLKDIRTSLRQWTAGVGAVAIAVLTGVGWTQADRLFPIKGPSWIAWLAGVSSGAALVAGVYVLVSLFAAQTRVLIGNEEELEKYKIRFRWGERELVNRALEEQALAESAPRLIDVDRRAQRLHRVATRLALRGDDLAKAADAEAKRLSEYVGLAELRVVLMLLERRARSVTRLTSLTALALLVAAFGIAGLFTAANYSQGKRAKDRAVTHCVQVLRGTGQASKCAKLVAP